jgi:hypothetical protein
VNGDGCYIPVDPADIFESGQNAIIGWDGEVERIYLSVNIYAEKDTTGFHVVPFPSMPEITLGSLSIFQNHTDQLEGFRKDYYDHDGESLGGNSDEEKGPSVEILYQESIGDHDVTVIKVNDVTDFKEELMEIVEDIGIDIDEWPDGMNRVITNYTLKGCNYFTVDNYPIYKKEKTVDPLVYQFETDELFFPLEISSIVKGDSLVRLALFTDPDIPLDNSVIYTLLGANFGSGFFVSNEVISNIDKDLSTMFPAGALHQYVQFEIPLSRVRGDFIIPREKWISWWDLTDDDDPYDKRYEMTTFNELGIILYLCHDDLEGGSAICMDAEDGSIRWEWIPPEVNRDIFDYRFVSEDFDLDGKFDILVYGWELGYPNIYRLDPMSGEEMDIDLPQLYFFPEKLQVFKDADGKDFMGIMSTYKIVVIDPDTWECIAVLESPEEKMGANGRSEIPMDNYIMHRWEDFGDGIIFHDGYHQYAWSPFYEMPDGSGPSGNITEKNIWVQDFRFQFEFEHDGTDYYFGTRWVSTPATYLYTFDPDTGDLIAEVSYEEFPELEDMIEKVVMDVDNDGDEELIVFRQERNGESVFFATCLDPITGKRYWNTEMGDDLWFLEGIEIIDLDDDGSVELIFHFEEGVFVLSSLDGSIVWTESECQLLGGYPDLDGDGGRELITSHFRNNVRITDPLNNTELLNVSCNLEDGAPFICRDLDNDGYQDILYLEYEWGYYGPKNLVIIDGKTREEMRFVYLYDQWGMIGAIEREDSYLIVMENWNTIIGVRIDEEMMKELRNSGTEVNSITILEGGYENERSEQNVKDDMNVFYVSALVIITAIVIVLGIYIPIIKRRNRQR